MVSKSDWVKGFSQAWSVICMFHGEKSAKIEGKEGKKRKVYSTRYSQAVTHPSTNRARRCLTSVIGREPVFSTWYGRRHEQGLKEWHIRKRWLPTSRTCTAITKLMLPPSSLSIIKTHHPTFQSQPSSPFLWLAIPCICSHMQPAHANCKAQSCHLLHSFKCKIPVPFVYTLSSSSWLHVRAGQQQNGKIIHAHAHISHHCPPSSNPKN